MYDQIEEHFETVWRMLDAAREDLIPEGDEGYDQQWDDVCHAMAVLKEAVASAAQV